MTKEQLASLLTGSEYPLRVPKAEAAQAKADGLVIVYGASDDLMEFEGAIHDEIGAYEGAEAFIVDGDLWPGIECEHERGGCKHARAAAKKVLASASKIEALWCAEEGYSWTYKTDIPHTTFEIVEDGEPYCRGIVFNLSDTANAQ